MLPTTDRPGAPARPPWGLRPRDLVRLGALALAFSLANAAKPLVMDDSLYTFYAGQIARSPLDPYGFRVLGYQEPTPAIEILSPVFMQYWWGLAIRLFGEAPALWKLWFLPFHLLFAGSLLALFRRFARGWEWPLTIMTVLSPVFLPSPNLMLDVPSLALGLAAVATFLAACDRGRASLAALAGLAAGLSIGTKYTGLLAPAVLMAYALLARRSAPGLLAVAVAFGLFAGWEGWIASVYGRSHFLIQSARRDLHWLDKVNLARALVTNLGGVAPATALLGLAALRAPARWVRGLGLAIAIGYGWIGLARVDGTVFLISGLLAIGTGLALAYRLARPREVHAGPSGSPDRDDRFLLLWLALEVAGAMFIGTFPASRRLMGAMVVGTLMAGRMASRTCLAAPRASLVRGIAAAGVLLGVGFYAVDLREALAVRGAVEAAARTTRDEGPEGAVWYVGRWGFRYYAERAGMRPLVPDRSELKPGDWLVIADPTIVQPTLVIDPEATRLAREISIRDRIPYRTQPNYYVGRTPLRHADGPRLTVKVLRVTAPWTPKSDPRTVAQTFPARPTRTR